MSIPRMCAAIAAVVCGVASSASAVTLLDESFGGADGTQPTGFAAFAASPMVSQNDGNGEYEQGRTSTGGGTVAVGLYNDANEIDKGVWRDVSITSNTRYSGGADNDNGVIFRAHDVAGTSAAAGNFYMVRTQGNSIELYRNVGGGFSFLASDAVDLSSILNRDWQISVKNIANPDTDHVRIQASLSNGGDPPASIDFTDTSPDAITRAGGVGYRSFNNAASVTRSTFDDLVVTGNNPDLLWYDDYSDGTAPRMASPAGTGTRSAFAVSNDKLQSSSTSSGTAITSLEFPTWTSNELWEDVEVTALMRLNTNDTGSNSQAGILARGNDITGTSNTESEYYYYRLNRLESSNQSQAQLLRKNAGGGFDFLQTTVLDSLNSVPESENIFLKLETLTLGDGVLVKGLASLSEDFSNPFGLINFLDSSASRILGPGTAGMRVFGTGPVNYDNFTVTHIEPTVPEPGTGLLVAIAGTFALTLRRRRR